MIVLGLSFYYHDSAAAIVKDGVLVAAADHGYCDGASHHRQDVRPSRARTPR